MSETKVVVPEGMLKAACAAAKEFTGGRAVTVSDVLEAALRCLSEHPIVPTDEQMMEFRKAWESEQWGKTQAGKGDFFAWCLTEWQRIMFRAPEPEVPEAVKDLFVSEQNDVCKMVNDHILEAYRRGQRAK